MKKLLIILLSVFLLIPFTHADNLTRRISYELGKVEGTIPQINMLIKKGEKVQAREMVEEALKQMEQIEAYQKEAALNGYDMDEDDLLIPQTQETKRFLVNKAAQLKNAINVYIRCEAKVFDNEYRTLTEEIQGQLSDLGCSFLDNAEQADWTITITASSRQGNKMQKGNFTTYFSYVDMQLTIDKMANGKRVYQNAFKEKGGDTRNFEYAANEAYQEIISQITPIIKEQITK